jgi:hypothetical protein
MKSWKRVGRDGKTPEKIIRECKIIFGMLWIGIEEKWKV